MAFVSGPRQVGKTTIAKDICNEYINWDNQTDRAKILQGPNKVAEMLNVHELKENRPIVSFDELHKYSKWKIFLKGFFDSYADDFQSFVTGSARLNIFRRGGGDRRQRRDEPVSDGDDLGYSPDGSEKRY